MFLALAIQPFPIIVKFIRSLVYLAVWPLDMMVQTISSALRYALNILNLLNIFDIFIYI